MKQFVLGKSLGCATLTILGLSFFAQIEQITCPVTTFGDLIPKALTPDQVATAWNHPSITENPLYTDSETQRIIDHIKTSPNVGYLKFIQDIASTVGKDPNDQATDLEKMEKVLSEYLKENKKVGTHENITLLKLLEEFKGRYENSSPEQKLKVASEIFGRAKEDHAKAKKVTTRYQKAIAAGRYAVILDNEGDDLLYLWANFADEVIPKVIITYGGFVELRFQAVKKFVTALCEAYRVPEKNRPKVYKGFPNPDAAGQKRHSYDPEEGMGYIEEGLRKKYIKKSQDLETRLKDNIGRWLPSAWDDKEFEDGLNALKELIGSGYTAIAVLTCPATVAHLISKDEGLATNIGVTMSSPWFWYRNGENVHYRPAFNGARQVSVMNKLLESKIDFIGVGGGTARTKGMRTIHDTKYGSGAAKDARCYGEKGLKNLEKVLSVDSKVEFLKIIALAGQDITRPSWRYWDKSMSKLWKFLGIKPMDRPNLASMREVPEGHEELRGGTDKGPKDPNKLSGIITWWNTDAFLTWSKIWLIWENPVKWQAPSADLHALITTKAEYLEKISGVARYKAKDTGAGGLVKFAKPEGDAVTNEEGVFYSVTDMDFQVIIEKLQKMLDGVSSLKK